jgi:putative PIN family toxin of toxin-antitoxin system
MLTTSPWLIEEYTHKLRTKFKVSEGDADLAGALLKDFALLVTPRVVLDVIAKDPDDNHVLACAVAGKADFIVTGDKHLLNLSSLKVSKS